MAQQPVLYSFRRCPYAVRARMALITAGVQCELREVNLSDKPAGMLAASPKGTVPVLTFADGGLLEESLDIMLWALSQADGQPWLTPPIEGMQKLIERNDSEFKFHLDRYKYPDRYSDEDNDPLTHRFAATAFAAGLEERLEEQDFLFGERPSLADLAIFPFVRQFAAIDAEWFRNLEFSRLQAWLSGWLQSELFATAMQRHPVWKAGDTPDYLLAART